MTRAEKTVAIEQIKHKLTESEFFYLTDSSTLTVDQVNQFRGLCFEKGVEMKVVKNTLMHKALEQIENHEDYQPLLELLKGPTAILFTDTANVPAKILREFRKDHERPVLKGAFIDKEVYVGDDQIKVLADLKSKEDLVAEIVALLQSPMKNLLGALQSGGNTVTGLLRALEERNPE